MISIEKGTKVWLSLLCTNIIRVIRVINNLTLTLTKYNLVEFRGQFKWKKIETDIFWMINGKKAENIKILYKKIRK